MAPTPNGPHGSDPAPIPHPAPVAHPCCCTELRVYLDRIEVKTKTKSLFIISFTDDEAAVTAAATSSSSPGVQTAKWPDTQPSWGLNDSDNNKKENISFLIAKFVTPKEGCHIDLEVVAHIWRVNFAADLKRALEEAAASVAPPTPGLSHATLVGTIDSFIDSFFNVLGLGRTQMDEMRLHFNGDFFCHPTSLESLLVGGHPSAQASGNDTLFLTATSTKQGGNWEWRLRVERTCPPS